MIGGIDRILATSGTLPAAALSFVVRSVREHWGESVVQDADSGKVYAFFSEIPFRNLREIFVYRTMRDCESWEALGADPCNEGSMLHLLAEDDTLTVVSDDAGTPMVKELLGQAQSFFVHSGWCTSNPRQAA